MSCTRYFANLVDADIVVRCNCNKVSALTGCYSIPFDVDPLKCVTASYYVRGLVSLNACY